MIDNQTTPDEWMLRARFVQFGLAARRCETTHFIYWRADDGACSQFALQGASGIRQSRVVQHRGVGTVM